MTRLICGKREFEVQKKFLSELELFHKDPSLLKRPYSVSSKVSLPVFEVFVDAVTGKDVDVTLDNYTELALLSEEFGFHCLDRHIEVHRSLRAEGMPAQLVKRLSHIENSLDGMRLNFHNLQSLEPRVTALEGRASSAPDSDTAKLEKLLSEISRLDKDLADERRSRRRHVTALEGRVSSVPANDTAKLEKLQSEISRLDKGLTDARESRQRDVTALGGRASSAPANDTAKLEKLQSEISRLDKDLADERRSRRRDITALRGLVASVPDNSTAQITAERNERLARVKDLSATVQAQGAKLDVVTATLEKLATDISKESKSRQGDVKTLKRKLNPSSESIQNREVTQISTSGARKEFRFAGEKFNGVIAHFTKMCSGNAADKGLVDMTASSVWSDDRRPRNALDLNSGNCYLSEDKPDQWFCLDFKARKVTVTHYALRSSYLKSWILEGSCDGHAWNELDKRDDNEDMKKDPWEASFAVADRGEYRFIRIRQTGHDQTGDDNLVVYRFELFGTLIE